MIVSMLLIMIAKLLIDVQSKSTLQSELVRTHFPLVVWVTTLYIFMGSLPFG